MLRDMMKKALVKAIKSFFTYEDLFDENFLYDCAQEYVYEHDLDVKSQLLENIDLSDDFEDILSEIDVSDIF